MPRTKTFLKPKKGNLLVKMGRKESDATVEGAMAGMQRGEARGGDLWGKTIKPVSMPEPDNLDADGIARKRAIISLLTSVIMPNSLSSKSTAEMDRRSLINKLNKSTFVEIKRLVPDRIKRMPIEKLQGILDGTEEILDEEKVEIQNLYMDISL